MANCENCDTPGAEYDCNGLKFCGGDCFVEWDKEEAESMDEFATEYEAFFVKGERAQFFDDKDAH